MSTRRPSVPKTRSVRTSGRPDPAPHRRAASEEEAPAAERTPTGRTPRDTPQKRTSGRTARAPAPARRKTSAGTGASTGTTPVAAPQRVVDASTRFRGRRPWLRPSRVLTAVSIVVVLIAAGFGSLFLPVFRLDEVRVAPTEYVDLAPVVAVAETQRDVPLLFVDRGAVEEAAASQPGVAAAEVAREWPATLTVTVEELAPAAIISGPDGQRLLAADGTELPEAAAGAVPDDQPLPTATVGAATEDPAGATEALLAVIGAVPPDLAAAMSELTATSRDDVTLTVTGEDGAAKQVVWGSGEESDLKAKVVSALMDQPGTVIDVSSPYSPVTR